MKRTAQEMLGNDAARNDRHGHGQPRAAQPDSSSDRAATSDGANSAARGSGAPSTVAESSAAAAQRRKHNEAGYSQPSVTLLAAEKEETSSSSKMLRSGSSSTDDVKEVRMDIDNLASLHREPGSDDATMAPATSTSTDPTQAKLKQKQTDVRPSSDSDYDPASAALSAAITQQAEASSSRTPHSGESASSQAVESAEDKHKKAQLQLIFEELVCDICLELMVDPAAMTPCQHVFCWSCAKTWMQDSSKCPTCATPITYAHLNHKLVKLVDLAVCLAPADRLRPEVETKAAKARLEQHKALFGSGTIRATARYIEEDDHHHDDMAQYWPCLACRPGNRSGFQCTHRIPDPMLERPPPARGAGWPQIEDADEDGVMNVEYHDSCTGCSAWIPAKAPGIDVRCFTCSEACCQAFDAEGSCPEGFKLYKLNNLEALEPRSFTTPRSLLDQIPLAGINEVEKIILQQYIDDKRITIRTMLEGIYAVAKRSIEASGRAQATAQDEGNRLVASRYTDIDSMRAGAMAEAYMEEAIEAEDSGAADEEVDTLRRAQWKYTLVSNVVRFESVRSAFRHQSATATHHAHASAPQPTRIGSYIQRYMSSGQRAGDASGSGSGSASASGSGSGTGVASSSRVNDSTRSDTTPIPLQPLKLEGELAEFVTSSAFCYDCLTGIIGAFLIWWWLEEKEKAASDERADSLFDRPYCSNGFDCRDQMSRAHCREKNHICKPTPQPKVTSTSSSGLEKAPAFDKEDADMIYTIAHEAATAAAKAALARLSEETRRVNEEVAAVAAVVAASQGSSSSTRQLRPRGPSGPAR